MRPNSKYAYLRATMRKRFRPAKNCNAQALLRRWITLDGDLHGQYRPPPESTKTVDCLLQPNGQMLQKRDRRAAMNALWYLALAGLSCTSATTTVAADEHYEITGSSESSQQRLGVIVPAHRGDLDRAVSSLDRWPKKCSPVTQENVNLVLYYAEGKDDPAAAAALPTITDSAGRCFANTRLVYANLAEDVRVYYFRSNSASSNCGTLF